MRMHSRITRSLVVAATAILALTACGGGGSGGEGSDDGGSATAGTVNWWSWTPDNNVAEREIAGFNKQYPDIKVIYKKVPIDNYAAVLKPALASDDGPDVYTVNASGSFSAEAFAPYAYDLTPDVEKLLGEDWKTKVYDGGVNAFTVKDRLVAAQWAKVGAGIMWINQEMFDKYDLKPPTTLAEWESVCKTFRSKGLGCFREGMSGTAGFVVDTVHSIADSHQPGVWAAAMAGTGKWTDPVMVQSLETLRTLSKNGILDEGAVGIQQYPDVNNAFLSGKVPMVQMGTWYQQYATVDSLTAALAGAGVPDGHAEDHHRSHPVPRRRRQGQPLDHVRRPRRRALGQRQVEESQRSHHLRALDGTHQGGPADRREQHGLLRHAERGIAAVREDRAGRPRGAEAQA